MNRKFLSTLLISFFVVSLSSSTHGPLLYEAFAISTVKSVPPSDAFTVVSPSLTLEELRRVKNVTTLPQPKQNGLYHILCLSHDSAKSRIMEKHIEDGAEQYSLYGVHVKSGDVSIDIPSLIQADLILVPLYDPITTDLKLVYSQVEGLEDKIFSMPQVASGKNGSYRVDLSEKLHDRLIENEEAMRVVLSGQFLMALMRLTGADRYDRRNFEIHSQLFYRG